MKKVKLTLSLCAVILGSVFAFAGTSNMAVQWTFIGSTPTDIQDATKYSKTAAEPTGCGSGVNLPCRVNFPNGTNTSTDLQNYLDTHTPANVLSLSPNKRN